MASRVCDHNMLLFKRRKIRCPFCKGNEIRVVDKRESSETDVIRRRRECLNCEKRFTTYERMELGGIFE